MIKKSGGISPFKIVNQSNDINNQIQDAQAEGQGSREENVNALEALAKNIHWGKIDPKLFSESLFEDYSPNKLYVWNDGKGMTSDVLLKVCDFSSSHGKQQGRKGNKGKGGIMAWMRVSSAGLVWISCAKDPSTKLRKVHLVKMIGECDDGNWSWGREKVYVTTADGRSGYQEVIDITDQIDLEKLDSNKFDIDKDWTVKIFCGTHKRQNTVEQPFENGVKIASNWLWREMQRRFPILPPGVTITTDNALKSEAQMIKVFKPVLPLIKELTDNNEGCNYETVTVQMPKGLRGNAIGEITSIGKKFPFYTDANSINITYVLDPETQHKNNTYCKTYEKSRAGHTGVFSGVIYKGELYDYRGDLPGGGNTWKPAAAQLGIMSGYKNLRVFVSLPEHDEIGNDENRTKIQYTLMTGPEEIKLTHFREPILAAMPDWFRKIIEDNAPKVDSLDTIRKKLSELLKKSGLTQPADKLGGNGSGRIPTPTPPKGQKQCPECAKNGIVTFLKQGVRKCPVCGWIKPKAEPKDRNNLKYVANPLGTFLMPTEFPEIKVIKTKEDIKEFALDNNFIHRAAQYNNKDNVLYVNSTHNTFLTYRNELLKELDENSVMFPKWLEQAMIEARTEIVQNYLGIGLVNSILAIKMKGFDDEECKHLTSSENLTVYAGGYIGAYGQEKLQNHCKEFTKMRKSFQGQKTNKVYENLSEKLNLDKKWVDAGGKLPKTAGAFATADVI